MSFSRLIMGAERRTAGTAMQAPTCRRPVKFPAHPRASRDRAVLVTRGGEVVPLRRMFATKIVTKRRRVRARTHMNPHRLALVPVFCQLGRSGGTRMRADPRSPLLRPAIRTQPPSVRSSRSEARRPCGRRRTTATALHPPRLVPRAGDFSDEATGRSRVPHSGRCGTLERAHTCD